MDFYHMPGSSSQAAHILLREARLDFRPYKVDIFSQTFGDGADYRHVNPNGYVPAIVLDDDTLLTENVAIIDWIACQAPDLVPLGPLGRTLHLQMLAFISTELQKPFIRLFFIEDPEEKTRLRENLAQRFRWIASKIEGGFLFGDRFTGADAFLYVMLRWAAMTTLDVPPEFAGFVERVEGRESVKAVIAAEELQPLCRPPSPLPAT